MLLERVAAGGMGEIFRARAVGPGGRVVAIKRMLPEAADDPTFVGMFIDEARVASKIGHPNIARLYEFGEHEGQYFLALEWIDGASLYEIVRTLGERGERLEIDQTARMFQLIALALDYAHALTTEQGEHMGLVHRDVSPANIMITTAGQPKVLDFGLAKAKVQLQRTQPGFVKGKFGYLAPEQLDGKADARTDLFALGLCMYEVLTGKKLFDRPSPTETVRAIEAFKTPPSIRAERPEVPEALEEVVFKLLAPRREDRYQSGAEVARAIVSALPAITLAGPTLDAASGFLVGRLFPERIPNDGPRRPVIEEELTVHPHEKWLRIALYVGTGLLVLLVLGILSAGLDLID